MKKDSKKKAPRSAQLSREIVRDWAPLFKRLTDVIDWALDIASQLSRNYHEEGESIEKVRTFVHAWLEGQRAELPLNDLLTTIAILFAAIEIDLGIDSVSLLAPLRTMLDTPSAAAEGDPLPRRRARGEADGRDPSLPRPQRERRLPPVRRLGAVMKKKKKQKKHYYRNAAPRPAPTRNAAPRAPRASSDETPVRRLALTAAGATGASLVDRSSRTRAGHRRRSQRRSPLSVPASRGKATRRTSAASAPA